MSMTRDEALKTIAALLQHTETDCDYAYDNTDGSVDLLPGQDISDALRLALAALREQEERRWIPVTERMPESDNQVLAIVSGRWKNVTFDHAYELASWSADEGWIIEAWPEMENPEATYWMPLPEPVKEGL